MIDSDKKLSPYEYFEIVQIEYICSMLRAKIYRSQKDKEYWNKVAIGKKITIEEIAHRNKLPTIFTDSDLESTLNRRVYQEDTHPLFRYKDEEHRMLQETYDFYYYYYVGVSVRFDIGSGITVGTVASYTPLSKKIVIDVEGESVAIETERVVRIL